MLVGVTRTERSPVLSLALAGSTKFSSGATSTQARYGCAGSLTQRREGSAELSGLPYVYLLKATIILLALLLIIQGISEILKAIVSIRQGNSRFDL